MTTPIFVDTGYILALVNSSDAYHQRASAASQRLQPPFLITEAVLTEIGNALSRQRWRSLAVATINDLIADPEIEVLSVSTNLFKHALQLYRQRPDKDWGMTDCISFITMQERGLTQVLTTDHHFIQAGFHSILMTLPD